MLAAAMRAKDAFTRTNKQHSKVHAMADDAMVVTALSLPVPALEPQPINSPSAEVQK